MIKIFKFLSISIFIFAVALSCNDNDQSNIELNQPSQKNISNLNESNENISKIQPNTQIVNSGQVGIWVNGQSKIMIAPDIVEMSVGIESTNKIVSESVKTVSIDHEKLISILINKGIQENEIKTTRYTINPQYKYTKDGSELTGYEVAHYLSFIYRDIDKIGDLIDIISYGPKSIGDNLRINSINFSIENPKVFESKLRENAITDAKDKANEIAKIANVILGSPVYISENSPTNFTKQISESDIGIARMSVAPTTEISSGQLTLFFSVNMGFSIVK
ncbi:MAG: hypothetical protein CL723_00015 [Chloroflexi bacterium]|jgi:hypothetical protein|nr:hypothetical protein [Chloroflexota bacterium]|tara:strand:- start:463 stop:1293 length:831 start_codon:yes stop_codon:yes gene_type:complete